MRRRKKNKLNESFTFAPAPSTAWCSFTNLFSKPLHCLDPYPRTFEIDPNYLIIWTLINHKSNPKLVHSFNFYSPAVPLFARSCSGGWRVSVGFISGSWRLRARPGPGKCIMGGLRHTQSQPHGLRHTQSQPHVSSWPRLNRSSHPSSHGDITAAEQE